MENLTSMQKIINESKSIDVDSLKIKYLLENINIEKSIKEFVNDVSPLLNEFKTILKMWTGIDNKIQDTYLYPETIDGRKKYTSDLFLLYFDKAMEITKKIFTSFEKLNTDSKVLIYELRILGEYKELKTLVQQCENLRVFVHQAANIIANLKLDILLKILSKDDGSITSWTNQRIISKINTFITETDRFTKMINNLQQLEDTQIVFEETKILPIITNFKNTFCDSSSYKLLYQQREFDIKFYVKYNKQINIMQGYTDANKILECLNTIIQNALEELAEKDLKLDNTFTKIIQVNFNITEIKNVQNLQITIEDNGRGIPVEIFQNIFNKFYTYGKASGTGIGLNVVREILRNLGGQIEVSSILGQGTTFILLIPIFKEKPKEKFV